MALQRRRSVCIPLSELPKKEWSHLSKSQIEELGNSYKKAPHLSGGGVSFYDMLIILNECGFKVSEQRRKYLLREIADKEVKVLETPTLLWAANSLKKEREEHQASTKVQNSQFLDSFVALGGNSDKTGYINKQTLMGVIKNQFELTLDLEDFLDGLDGIENDRLNFEQFTQIMQKDGKALERQGSVRSINEKLSERTRTLQTEGSMKSLKISPQEFDRYWEKIAADNAA